MVNCLYMVRFLLFSKILVDKHMAHQIDYIKLGVVFFIVTIWSLKGTTFYYYARGEGTCKQYRTPIWMILVLGLIYSFPVINIIVFIAYVVLLIAYSLVNPADRYYYDVYCVRFSPKNVLYKAAVYLLKILTKTI